MCVKVELPAYTHQYLAHSLFDSSPSNKREALIVWEYLDSKDFQRMNRVCKSAYGLRPKGEMHINWSNVKMTYTKANDIINDLEKEGSIISINLASINVSESEYSKLMRRISQIKTLKKLNLADNSTSISGLPDLTKLPLTHLNLSSNFLLDCEIYWLPLKFPRSLTHIDLYYNLITKKSLSYLESMGLQECNLDTEEVSEDGLRIFFVRNCFLQRIKISEGNIFSSDKKMVKKVFRLIKEYEGSLLEDVCHAIKTKASHCFSLFKHYLT